MNVSAQVRYLDYSVRPVYAKNRRRSDDDALARRKAEPRPEDDRSEEGDHPAPEMALDDDDEGLGYSRQIPARPVATARKDMIAESVHPAPSLTSAALLSLMVSGDSDSRPRNVEPLVAKPSPVRKDSLYDLLDQVISQA